MWNLNKLIILSALILVGLSMIQEVKITTSEGTEFKNSSKKHKGKKKGRSIIIQAQAKESIEVRGNGKKASTENDGGKPRGEDIPDFGDIPKSKSGWLGKALDYGAKLAAVLRFILEQIFRE